MQIMWPAISLKWYLPDFGLARYLLDASCSLPSHRSTANYDPYVSVREKKNLEYGMGNEVSTYGDVYSYRILLLEMLTGKRPTDEMFKDDLNLHNFIRIALPECHKSSDHYNSLTTSQNSTIYFSHHLQCKHKITYSQ
ncbi:hypothetical protein DVH24_024311 [Malus domestica]|uniref:Protein kinase domain-containing protein n=1 Tax=Malus domestica TaxID=3750 RepID=A0A498JIG1_MALDO|nr:hypothetical protein DVH24_024311 [Malus domestica]